MPRVRDVPDMRIVLFEGESGAESELSDESESSPRPPF